MTGDLFLSYIRKPLLIYTVAFIEVSINVKTVLVCLKHISRCYKNLKVKRNIIKTVYTYSGNFIRSTATQFTALIHFFRYISVRLFIFMTIKLNTCSYTSNTNSEVFSDTVFMLMPRFSVSSILQILLTLIQ